MAVRLTPLVVKLKISLPDMVLEPLAAAPVPLEYMALAGVLVPSPLTSQLLMVLLLLPKVPIDEVLK